MSDIYIARKDGYVVLHGDKDQMMELDGVEPEITLTREEYDAIDGIVRIIDGEIFLGMTEEEKKAEENAAILARCRLRLAETDYIGIKIAEGSATKEEYADIIAQREEWRETIRSIGV